MATRKTKPKKSVPRETIAKHQTVLAGSALRETISRLEGLLTGLDAVVAGMRAAGCPPSGAHEVHEAQDRLYEVLTHLRAFTPDSIPLANIPPPPVAVEARMSEKDLKIIRDHDDRMKWVEASIAKLTKKLHVEQKGA